MARWQIQLWRYGVRVIKFSSVLFYDVVILLQLAVSLFLPVFLCDVRKMLCSAVKANVFIGHCVAELP